MELFENSNVNCFKYSWQDLWTCWILSVLWNFDSEGKLFRLLFILLWNDIFSSYRKKNSQRTLGQTAYLAYFYKQLRCVWRMACLPSQLLRTTKGLWKSDSVHKFNGSMPIIDFYDPLWLSGNERFNPTNLLTVESTVRFSFIPRSLCDFNEFNECLLFIYALQTSRLHDVFHLIEELWCENPFKAPYLLYWYIEHMGVNVWESFSARCPLSFVVEIRVSVWGCVHVCVSMCVSGCGQWGMVMIASRNWEWGLLSAQYFRRQI